MKLELEELKLKIEAERKAEDGRAKELQKKLDESKKEMERRKAKCVIL